MRQGKNTRYSDVCYFLLHCTWSRGLPTSKQRGQSSIPRDDSVTSYDLGRKDFYLSYQMPPSSYLLRSTGHSIYRTLMPRSIHVPCRCCSQGPHQPGYILRHFLIQDVMPVVKKAADSCRLPCCKPRAPKAAPPAVCDSALSLAGPSCPHPRSGCLWHLFKPSIVMI